jgi:rubredoxin
MILSIIPNHTERQLMAIQHHACTGGDFHTTTDFWECPNCGGLNAEIRTHKDTTDTGNDACQCGWLPDGSEPDARVEELIQAFNVKSELLAALERLHHYVAKHGPESMFDALDASSKAIAKAKGEL